MSAPGNKPFAIAGHPLPTVDLMADQRYTPTLREGLVMGAQKARLSVVFAHYEFRNYSRGGSIGTHGRVGSR